jgi:DNA-binding NarL/FixJ family response regulator
MTLPIVVVDELPLIRDGIAAALRSDPSCRIVDRGSSAADAVRLVDDSRTDQLIFGIGNIEGSLATIANVVA